MQNILVGRYSSIDLATNVILQNFNYLIFGIALAEMMVVSSMIGNKLGENNGKEARKVAFIGVIFMTLISIYVDYL